MSKTNKHQLALLKAFASQCGSLSTWPKREWLSILLKIKKPPQ